jgi:hypothetical protein
MSKSTSNPTPGPLPTSAPTPTPITTILFLLSFKIGDTKSPHLPGACSYNFFTIIIYGRNDSGQYQKSMTLAKASFI